MSLERRVCDTGTVIEIFDRPCFTLEANIPVRRWQRHAAGVPVMITMQSLALRGKPERAEAWLAEILESGPSKSGIVYTRKPWTEGEGKTFGRFGVVLWEGS